MECFEVNKLNNCEKEKFEDRLNQFPKWITIRNRDLRTTRSKTFFSNFKYLFLGIYHNLP